MSEMIERVARAMVAADSGPEGSALFEIHWEEFGEIYHRTARAAIAAMRVPTEAMLNAALEDHDIKCGLDDCNKHDIPERAWEIMVDAALSAPAAEPK